MQKIIALAEKVLNGQDITKEEAEFLINVSDDDTMLLLAMADKIRQNMPAMLLTAVQSSTAVAVNAARTASSAHNLHIIIPVLRNTVC